MKLHCIALGIALAVVSALLFLSPQIAEAAGKESIVAVVNNGVVTASDLQSRMDLVAASSGLQKSKELEARMRPQMMEMLIDEQIRLQEAKRLNLIVDEKDIDDGFAKIAQQNGMPPDAFKEVLKKGGVNMASLREQIKAQVAWTKVVQKQVRPKVNVSESDIDNELVRIAKKAGKEQYSIAEIYLPVNDPRRRDDALKFVTKLVDQLRKQPAAFEKAAQQFSQAPNAGKTHWIMLGAMPPEVDAVLPTLNKGDISAPIEIRGGFFVVKMQDKRPMTADMLPSRDNVLEKIGMERLDRAQRRYYIDLRSQAFIEKRG